MVVVRKVLREEHCDVIRGSVRAVARELMEAKVSELIGAGHGERTEDRATHRNGYRPRRWDTRAGEIELQIPKIRQGSYFPSFLQPRKRSEQALVSVVQQAYVCGVSTRPVDQLVESLGLRISKSEVSRIRRPARRTGPKRSASGRWRVVTRICSSTPRSRMSATAAAFSARNRGQIRVSTEPGALQRGRPQAAFAVVWRQLEQVVGGVGQAPFGSGGGSAAA